MFAGTGRLGRRPDGFTGSCPAVDGWTGGDCSAKVLGARHYLAGFGADRLSASASQSPYDDDGHGSEVASVAAGNADVSALSGGEDLGRFSGVAPRARIAVYKACWSAPTRTTTAARPPTWSRRSTRPRPTGWTCSRSR